MARSSSPTTAPGIAAATVERMLDFNVRVSDKEAYVSPTRGAQGNALKTIIAMPYVLDGKRGETVIETQGIKHSIRFEVDPIRREPRVTYEPTPGKVKTGTRITVRWPVSASSQLEAAKARFLLFAADFLFLNPHLTLQVTWGGKPSINTKAGDPAWTKWSPADPIPAHWYPPDRFEQLIVAHVAHDQDHGSETTVRDFVAGFRGLSASKKRTAILDNIDASRLSLAKFYDEGRNHDGVAQLLAAMKDMSKPVNPKDLGVIGRAHLEHRFREADKESSETFKYVAKFDTADGLPWGVEVAFAWAPGASSRRLITGVNFSPAIINPFRHVGDRQSLDDVLGEQWAGPDEPVMALVHLVCPRLSFTDRGKTTLVLGDVYATDDEINETDLAQAANAVEKQIGDAIIDAVTKATSSWAKSRRVEERDRNAVQRRRERLIRSTQVSTKDAAYAVMEEAYLAASANGTLPANARQVMYAARPKIQDITGKALDDGYFTQTLLPDFIFEYDVKWDVVFDDRGHFTEPHSDHQIGLGTLNVRDYLAGLREAEVIDGTFTSSHISTHGPHGNFGAVLFIEKEGFTPLFEAVHLRERFDIAIMSTKGMSNTAARQLVERLCGESGIPLFILHDFDKAGLAIASTLQRDTRRYQFKEAIQTIDLGLRLDDVIALGLEDAAEEAFDKGSEEARADNLAQNGATDEEIDFLLERRVELNALPSDRLITFIEQKLIANGVGKLVPNADMLAAAYQSNIRTARINEVVDRAILEATDEDVTVPDDLADQVADLLRARPSWRWDAAVAEIARNREA